MLPDLFQEALKPEVVTRRGGRSAVPDVLARELDAAVIDSVTARARLDGAAQVAMRGMRNLSDLSSEATRATMDCPTLNSDVQRVLRQYVSLTEAAMLRAALG